MLAVAVVGLAVIVGFVNPRFLSANNLSDLLLGNAYVAVAAIGMSMVIVSGNIDISVGALIGVLATVSGSLAVAGYPIALAWAAPLVLGMSDRVLVMREGRINAEFSRAQASPSAVGAAMMGDLSRQGEAA